MQNSTPQQKKHRGFTLLELMIVLAVISVLGALTVPKMMTVVNDISLRYAASDLSASAVERRVRQAHGQFVNAIERGMELGQRLVDERGRCRTWNG